MLGNHKITTETLQGCQVHIQVVIPGTLIDIGVLTVIDSVIRQHYFTFDQEREYQFEYQGNRHNTHIQRFGTSILRRQTSQESQY